MASQTQKDTKLFKEQLYAINSSKNFLVMGVTNPMLGRGVAQVVFHAVHGKVYKNYM
jgi:hypothetical protein